ncbi:thioredoxin-dependent thiol peroxidase [Adhaeribacter radiodurans]|uniref:thioredoxin-dependent peroxiredoxin n=1 Tax=Adhaeribacter radiodurans TaxID=2745197 RepID=A0A7L7LA80_9BACT|nr:thioredoxin-dependent thiol peroxidase [Adhaeribacter radiodurans]QMU29730.1 thioredoxin-dependent thiol peroxidase [Adhaeribacter radiodurans]
MALQIGDRAPDFAIPDQDGIVHKLSDYQGRKLVIYFYPKDDTPGCTAQACNLRDNYYDLRLKGYEVIGLSVDSEKSHQKFIQKFELPFTLLSDTDKKMVEAYGVWQEKSMYGRKYMGTMRYTFIIDEKGIIQDIITKVDTKDHAAQLVKS